MDYLQKLRELLKKKSGELDAIITKAEEEDRPLTTEEAATVKELSDKVEEIAESIDAQKAAERARGKAAAPADAPADGREENPDATHVQRQIKGEHATAQKMGLIAMAVTESEFQRRDFQIQINPLDILREVGFGQLADDVARLREQKQKVIKALNVSSNPAGGFLTPTTRNDEIIELLYPETTFLQGNPRRVNMPNGTYLQPAGASGSTASYTQEGDEITTTEPAFEEVSMSSKKLGAIVPMTREMIEWSTGGAQNFVETDLREAMSQVMDAKAYYGSGASGEPLGLFNRDGIIQLTEDTVAAPVLTAIDDSFDEYELAFLNRNLRNMSRWRYVGAPRTAKYIGSRRVGDAGNGEFAFPEMRGQQKSFNDIPYLHSTQFPINLGGSANQTDQALINFADVLLGTQGDVGLSVSSEASVKINGVWVSAFQNDLVFLRVISFHDIGMRRKFSVVLRRIRWGA